MLVNTMVPIFHAQNLLHILEKKKRLELNLWISVKNIWVLFFFGGVHPVEDKTNLNFFGINWPTEVDMPLNRTQTQTWFDHVTVVSVWIQKLLTCFLYYLKAEWSYHMELSIPGLNLSCQCFGRNIWGWHPDLEVFLALIFYRLKNEIRRCNVIVSSWIFEIQK